MQDVCEVAMEGSAKVIASVLLVGGTAGLLANEFAFDWGWGAAIGPACLNFLGPVILPLAPRRRSRKLKGWHEEEGRIDRLPCRDSTMTGSRHLQPFILDVVASRLDFEARPVYH